MADRSKNSPLRDELLLPQKMDYKDEDYGDATNRAGRGLSLAGC